MSRRDAPSRDGSGDGRPAPIDAGEAAALGRLGAAAGSGNAARLEAALAELVDRLDVEAIEELLLQTYLFAGFPRVINAFFTWQRWASEQGIDRGEPRVEPERPAAWRERGEALFREVYEGSFDALQLRLARLHPELAEWTLVEGYGKVLARPGVDAGRRELAAIGALVAQGAADRQLVSHLRGAIHVGVPPDRVAEAARAAAEAVGDEGVESLLGALP